jgi:hypothetical protein
MTPEPKTQPSLTQPHHPRITPPGEVNYRFRHRGTVLVVAPQGLVRLECYQRRELDRLSLDN